MAGLIGGAAITVVKGSSGPWPPFLTDWIAKIEKEHPWQAVILHLPRNAFLGGLAAFLVWTLGTAAASFDEPDLSPQQWGTYIVVGFAGGFIVDSLYERGKKMDSYAQALSALGDAVEELKKKAAGQSTGTTPDDKPPEHDT